MNRKLGLPLICIVIIILASHSIAEVDLTDIVENIYPAVVTVITFDKEKKPLGQGSGFFIDANGHLITNYHVLEGAYHAVAKTYDGKKYLIKSVIGENKEMDLIKVLADIPRSSVQWINATGALPPIAERVVVIGSPMGLELTVSEGIVSSVREIPDLGKILQISAAISPGSSGGPVVNMKGQVIGIVSFYLIQGQNLNFAIPAKYLLDLKPSKTIKTISEWAYGVDQKTLRKKPQESRLFVHTEPKEARVRILNIKPKFYQGIMLIPGPYHIEVSADGYEMKEFWIKIEPGENKKLKIPLKRISHVFVEEPISPKKATDYVSVDPTVVGAKVVDRDGRYEKYANGVVLDTKTGLEWYAGPDKDTTWYQAKDWVERLRVAGGGWRTPTIKELRALYQAGVGTNNLTPLITVTGWMVWSGEFWRGALTGEGRYFAFSRGYESQTFRNYSDDGTRALAVRSQRQ